MSASMKSLERRRPQLIGACALAGVAALALDASAQTQSLAFTGGALFNVDVSFSGLGGAVRGSNPGPSTGGAVHRVYDDGFNSVDSTGNADGTTARWGYQSRSQIQGDQLVLSAASGQTRARAEDVGNFVEPSFQLEYRGSMGPLGAADWGIILGIGYQTVNGEARESFTTSAQIIEDRYALYNAPGDLPEPPYSGSADSEGPRIGSTPNRSVRVAQDGMRVDGRWELDTDLFPVVGGVYLEAQLAGRLNGVVSAGFLAVLVDGDMSYRETRMVTGMEPVTASGRKDTQDALFGGFVQLGLDWALWENASLVASARWQPTQKFSENIDGRKAEIDFTRAFAVHAGVSFRF
jgi:hypothetical protein